ncbi:MFS transporter [Dongia sp.]|jgi:DHA1 family inner membrane transport protein|uniref:MFS transporter n=1 Tax=Dongia sp. TaxID=1977262 RepID=UPI0035B43D9B
MALPRSILALSAGCFGIGTTEFVVMGLLPDVARDLHVDIPQAGLLVTGYAVGVVIGAPILAILTGRLPRKGALLGLMGVFMLGNLFCALAPTYDLMLAARVFTAFAHAAFMGIGAVVAADLAPRHQRAQAMALTMAGLTVANVLGVPGGTAFGQAFGWRFTFVAVAIIGAVAALAVALMVPKMPARRSASLIGEFRVLKRPQVVIGMAMSALSAAAMFSVYTYIRPILTDVTGIAATSVTYVLVVFGLGLTFGNLVGGRLADWKLMPSLIALFLGIALLLALFTVTAANPVTAIATLIVWGIAGFAVVAPLQMHVVIEAKGAPNLVSVLNHAGFNIGCASGAFLGGLPIAHGLGYHNVPWVGAAVAFAACLVGLFSLYLARRQGKVAESYEPDAVEAAPAE